MATTYKVLAQTRPSTTSLTNSYTVPANTQAVLSSIVLAHTHSNTSFITRATVYIRPGGAGAADSQILIDEVLALTDSQAITSGITLSAGDVISIVTNVASSVTMHVFGSEIV